MTFPSLKLSLMAPSQCHPVRSQQFAKHFRGVQFKQTYGLSEVGILRHGHAIFGSVWLKLGDTGFEHKIVNGVLWIRSPSAMLGYLNASSPFDANGWFNTKDLVEKDGEYIRILGRESELINVGGEKVHPTEIENLLLQLDNAKTLPCAVGQIRLPARSSRLKSRRLCRRILMRLNGEFREFCSARLERYKICRHRSSHGRSTQCTFQKIARRPLMAQYRNGLRRVRR